VGTGSSSRGITETDVWQAADALLLEGARPTIERVRQKVGRGSPNTVSPYLDTWFRKLGARIKDPMTFSAPPAIPDPVQQAATHFWGAALASARAQVASELATEREAIDADRLAATEEKAALAAERERLAVQMQAREDVAQALRDQLADVARQVEDLRDQLREQAVELTSARDRAATVTAERDALRAQLEAARAAHEKARAEVEARAQAHEKRWTMEVDRAREAAKLLQAQFARLEKDSGARIEKLTHAAGQSENGHRQAERARASDQAELQRLRKEIDGATKRESVMGSQIAKLQEQLSRSLEQLSSRDAEHSKLLRVLAGRPTAPRSAASTGRGKRQP
jgi:DNA repair exonuclease SbcCD ATPase subunit